MQKKTQDLEEQVQRSPPDLKRLQLLLQGCVSTQVNQGVQEYSVFLSPPHIVHQEKEHLDTLKEVYRYTCVLWVWREEVRGGGEREGGREGGRKEG